MNRLRNRNEKFQKKLRIVILSEAKNGASGTSDMDGEAAQGSGEKVRRRTSSISELIGSRAKKSEMFRSAQHDNSEDGQMPSISTPSVTVHYSPIAWRTSFTVAGTDLNSCILAVITSGSFNPCPVTVQTIRLCSEIV